MRKAELLKRIEALEAQVAMLMARPYQYPYAFPYVGGVTSTPTFTHGQTATSGYMTVAK